METAPAIDKAVDCFKAHTIIGIRSGEGSTVRFYNPAEEEFMKLRTDRVSKRFQPLFDEKPWGVRHAEDGRLYAILADPDKEGSGTREEPVDVFPFADVQVGPDCEFGRRISAVAVEYGPAAVKAEYGFTSAVECLHTKSNAFISFYESETSDDPWLRVCEPA